jgi:hypothetical protein
MSVGMCTSDRLPLEQTHHSEGSEHRVSESVLHDGLRRFQARVRGERRGREAWAYDAGLRRFKKGARKLRALEI